MLLLFLIIIICFSETDYFSSSNSDVSTKAGKKSIVYSTVALILLIYFSTPQVIDSHDYIAFFKGGFSILYYIFIQVMAIRYARMSGDKTKTFLACFPAFLFTLEMLGLFLLVLLAFKQNR